MKLAITLTIMLLLTAACAQDSAPAPVVEQPTTDDSTPEEETTPNPILQPPEFDEETTPDANVPSDIAELSDDGSDPYDIFRSEERPTTGVDADLDSINERIEDKTNGFVYTYRVINFDEPGDLDNVEVYEQNDRRLVVLPARVRGIGENVRADHILFTQEATYAWCEDCIDSTRLVEVANPEQYIPPSPVSWLDSVESLEPRSGKQVDGRTVDTFTVITTDDEEFVLGVDRFSGVPLLVEKDGFTHTYEGVSFAALDSAFALPEQE